MAILSKFYERAYALISCLYSIVRGNISLMYLLQTSGLLELRLVISFSTVVMKMLPKATAILVPIAVQCEWR